MLAGRNPFTLRPGVGRGTNTFSATQTIVGDLYMQGSGVGVQLQSNTGYVSIGASGDFIFQRVAAGFAKASGAANAVGGLVTNPTTVGSLPAASSALKGARAFVTDANATHTAGIGTIVAAGGSNNVPVVCDGTNWRIG